jgi:hypothetical protein
MNFWSFLLLGIITLADWLITFLFGGPEGRHAALGLASVIGYNAYVVLEVTYATLGNFNMTLPLIAFAVSGGAWLIRLISGLYLYIRLLIQGGGR